MRVKTSTAMPYSFPSITRRAALLCLRRISVKLSYRNAVMSLLTIGAVFTGRGALAHHSFAMYDSQKVIAINGVIKAFQWSNPHVIVWLVSGPTAGAEPQLWTIELPTSPGGLVRMGWDKRSLNAGDRVIMEINPLRSGEHGGSFKRATLVDSGKVLAVNPPAALAKAGAN